MPIRVGRRVAGHRRQNEGSHHGPLRLGGLEMLADLGVRELGL